MKIEGITIIIVIKIAIRLPMFDKYIASYPFLFFRSLCPGRIESSVSVSGQPRNIEGMKSIKVWVIAIEVMKVIT